MAIRLSANASLAYGSNAKQRSIHSFVMNKDNAGLIDADTAKAWQSKILSIASDYEDQFVSDGAGGLMIHNPRWMASVYADVDTAADYVYAEATLRVLLYKLTSDSHQLDLARGLISHQVSKHWIKNAQGWELLKEWPDIKSWSSRAQAPHGSIWDSFTYNADTAEITSAAVFLTELFHIAKEYGVSSDIGLTPDLYSSHQSTFQEFIRVASADPTKDSLIRNAYPLPTATASDLVSPNRDIFSVTGFVYPETADASFVPIAWQAMMARGQGLPTNYPIGYFLLAWARTESATLAPVGEGGN